VKFGCIDEHRDRFDVALMCRVLRVSRAGYYAWRTRQQVGRLTVRAARDERMRLAIRTAYAKSRQTYGAPRIHAELRSQGERVAKKRVARLMRADGLTARRPRRRMCTTDARHTESVAPNALARRFAVDTVANLNRIWVADITYVPTREGWLFLAVVLDLASRRVVGWAMRATLDRDVAVAALRMALADRQPGGGLLHHSDRGSQYASGDYRALLHAHGLTQSMSRAGDCYDNAVAESFFATLEHEVIARSDWPTREAARRAIFAYIVEWYNRERRHSSLGYVSPVQYERQVEAQQAV
jgi:putative transposase